MLFWQGIAQASAKQQQVEAQVINEQLVQLHQFCVGRGVQHQARNGAFFILRFGYLILAKDAALVARSAALERYFAAAATTAQLSA